jgi:Transcriptional regulator PadR-like family
VPWAITLAWATEIVPAVRASAVAGRGPRNRARAVRTALAAAPAPRRSRARSQPAVEAASWPWSAPAAPPASTVASSWSQWPSRRSSSRRTPSTRSARMASGSPSRSWAANPSTAVLSAASPSGRPVGFLLECVFESMGGTYQAPTRRQAPNPNLWTNSCHRPHQNRAPAGVGTEVDRGLVLTVNSSYIEFVACPASDDRPRGPGPWCSPWPRSLPPGGYANELCQRLGLEPGTLYPVLMWLTDRGLLETTWDWESGVAEGQPRRHLYRLTGPGRALAGELTAGGPAARAAGVLGRRPRVEGA